MLGKAEVVASIKAQAEQRAVKISWGRGGTDGRRGRSWGLAYPQFDVGRVVVGSRSRRRGPRAINDAIAAKRPEVEEAILDEISKLAASVPD